MKQQIHLTKHSKERFTQRTDYADSETQHLASVAFNKGYEFSRFKEPFSSYLKSLCHADGKYVAKVYNDYVYIFNNAYGHRLLTIYKVDDKWLPIEQYLFASEDLLRCWIVLVDKETGETFYWSEYNDLTKDLGEILDFTSQIKAKNYIANNRKLKSYADQYEIDIF